MTSNAMIAPVSALVWRNRYAAAGETNMGDSIRRIAQAVAFPEPRHREYWRQRFERLMLEWRFLPGGRIWHGAGSAQTTTLFNCFASGTLPDALDGLVSALGESLVTLQLGGGLGCDFSTLRPAGSPAIRTGNVAAGPVAFLQVWEAAATALRQRGGRGSALLGVLRCDHPDIESFIDAKQRHQLSHFNLSVLVSDALMAAIEQDAPWPLVFPLNGRRPKLGEAVCLRDWPGYDAPQLCVVMRTVRARELWLRLQRAAYDHGEPGVIFIDHVQRANNLYYAERIHTCNPCAEVPLPPHGACNLGAMNLPAFVRDPFVAGAALDLAGLADAVTVATRFLDNVYDISNFPLRVQRQVARGARRLGIGLTGLGSTLAMLGLRYGSVDALALADAVMRTICHAAYRASIGLAQERGVFPAYRVAPFLQGDFIQRLPADIIADIGHYGMRNSHLTALAPAGAISLLAGNVSCGMEPIRQLQAERRLCLDGGGYLNVAVEDYALSEFRRQFGPGARLPDALAHAAQVDPGAHLEMVARLQTHVDQSISHTLILSPDTTFEQFQALFARAWRFGTKGCTAIRSLSCAS